MTQAVGAIGLDLRCVRQGAVDAQFDCGIDRLARFIKDLALHAAQPTQVRIGMQVLPTGTDHKRFGLVLLPGPGQILGSQFGRRPGHEPHEVIAGLDPAEVVDTVRTRGGHSGQPSLYGDELNLDIRNRLTVRTCHCPRDPGYGFHGQVVHGSSLRTGQRE